MENQPKTARIQVMISDLDARKLDEYRWRNRVPSQAEAVRQLINKGLAAEAVKDGDAAAKPEEV